MNNATLINQTSGKVEFWTPQPIIEAARETMGGIDLDPASCFEANLRVKADTFFDKSIDGLSREWFGRVWMNHPFGKDQNAKWINKLLAERLAGRITAACCITFASTSEKWFRPLLAWPQCYLYGRTNYFLPDGSRMMGCTKGSVVTYLGPDFYAFQRAFSAMGAVKV